MVFLKEIGPQNGGQFWTDEKKHTITTEKSQGQTTDKPCFLDISQNTHWYVSVPLTA